MRKCTVLLLVTTMCLGLLTGCCLSHDWAAATCETPSTCTKCGETEGEALGHDWVDATCETPETCEECGKTQGEALGHSFSGGSCVEVTVCDTCGTEGELAEHVWLDATRSEPQTCQICAMTQGQPLSLYEAYPQGQLRYDDTQFFLTPEDFIELYRDVLDERGYSLVLQDVGEAWPPLLYVANPEGEMTGISAILQKNQETGKLAGITIAYEAADPANLALYNEYGGIMMLVLEVLVGDKEETYADEFAKNMQIVGANEEMGSVTIATEIRGMGFLMESFESGATMIAIVPVNAV